MSNQYTSILTGGFSDNTVKQMYDFAFEAVFRESPTYRMWADKRPEQVNGPGQSIVLQKYNWFDDAAVTAAKTPLNEENDVDSRKLPTTSTVTLTVNEYGDAVTKTKKLQKFTFADIDRYAVTAVANHCADVMDELVQDVLVTGSQVFRAGDRQSTVTVTGSDLLKGAQIRKTVTKLRANKVPGFGQYYAAGIHPHVVHDLREESGSGGWRLPNEYGTDQGMLWRGEFGLFEGVRFVENTRTRKATDGAGGTPATVYRTFVQGRQAIAERVVEEPNVVLSPSVDKLKRFDTLGWYGILGWCLYRDESLVRLESSSSMAGL